MTEQTFPDADPAELAQKLEGVICAADMALTEEEIEYIGEAIGYLRADAKRLENIKARLDAAAEDSA